MPTETRTKKTFGGADITKIGPATVADGPKKINMTISFEEALKLHLSLGQALAKLNSYKRSTTEGRRSAVLLCLHQDLMRIAVLEGKLPS